MNIKEKVLKVLNPSMFCGDGSCGCGCGVPWKAENDKPQDRAKEVGASTDEESVEIMENPPE